MDVILDIETTAISPGKNLSEDGKDIGALSPITGKISGIGWKNKDCVYTFVDTNEKKVLVDFWDSVSRESYKDKGFIRLIGFAIKTFDIHFLLVRSLHHGITIPKFQKRYVIDLRETVTFGNTYMKKGTLNDYASLLGIEGKHADLTGDEVAALYHKGDLESIKKYLEQDVAITYELYVACEKTGLLYLG